MPAESVVATGARSRDAARRTRRDELPAWYPAWAKSIADLYFSRTTSVFVLHGNTYDLVPLSDVDAPGRATFGGVPERPMAPTIGRCGAISTSSCRTGG